MSISSIPNHAPSSTNERLTSTERTNSATLPESEAPGRADSDTSTAEKSVYVDLSPLARRMSSQGGGKNGAVDHADIDQSDLPSVVKDLLKRIRELKQQLRELQQQMQQVQSDASLSPEQRQTKLQQLQGQIQAVSAALSTANSALGKAVKQQNLSQGQLTEVTSFLAA